MVPHNESITRCSASLHRVRSGPVPLLQRYYQSTPTPCRPSRRASLPSLGGTTVRRSFVSPRQDRRVLPRPGVFGPATPRPVFDSGGDDRASHVPGGSSCAYALLSDPGGTDFARPVAASRCCPRLCPRRGLPRRVFRGSITRPLHSLSTLRSDGYPDATPDSLPSAGHALTDGVHTRWIPTKGLSSASYIASSFPELRDARTCTS